MALPRQINVLQVQPARDCRLSRRLHVHAVSGFPFVELIEHVADLCSDTMFYYMHTHAHADKWMYKMTHALHHEYTHEMNLFTTA